jgi:hypothetical protein
MTSPEAAGVTLVVISKLRQPDGSGANVLLAADAKFGSMLKAAQAAPDLRSSRRFMTIPFLL